MPRNRRVFLLIALAVATFVVGGVPAAQPTRVVPLAELPDIDSQALLARTRILASDEFEGRLPGTDGEKRTVAYLVEQFTKLGLAPGNTDGTYLQKVPLVGITPRPTADLTFNATTPTQPGDRQPPSGPGRSASTEREAASREPGAGASSLSLRWREDYVAWTQRVVGETSIAASDLVFVGYGVKAPEFDWDDFKDVDVAGKTMVVLVGDPPVPDPADPSRLDAKTFGGRAMTYYGRWTYKYEVAAARKAAGVIIVHETGPAGYPWGVVNGFGDERFNLRTPAGNMDRIAVEGWITLEAAKRLFAMAGQDYDALKKAAATRHFTPVPLGLTASVALRNTLREVDSANVVARLDGSDSRLAHEYVVYTAHWDHLGIGEPVGNDRIYNGAVDNATGTAGLLEIARAFKRLPTAPRRSVVFLAVTAEEQGLLGAQHYAEHPIYPLDKTLANINMDGLNVIGPTKDVTVIGLGSSDLDDYLREAAAEQGRVLSPDAEPEKGSYYRSDHFNFAKQGVPALYTDDGVEFVGKPEGHARKVRDDYTTNRYHKPQDEVLPSWDLSGAAQDLKLLFAVGLRVAGADSWPRWKPGNEFKAKRDAMLATSSEQ